MGCGCHNNCAANVCTGHVGFAVREHDIRQPSSGACSDAYKQNTAYSMATAGQRYCGAHKCFAQSGGVKSVSRKPTNYTDAVLRPTETFINATHYSELTFAVNNELLERSLSTVDFMSLNTTHFTANSFQILKNKINDCRADDIRLGRTKSNTTTLVTALNWSGTSNYSNGAIITANDITVLRNNILNLQQTCICQCNVACGCDNNTCTCYCNWCACQCNWSCPCDCNYSDKRLKKNIEYI